MKIKSGFTMVELILYVGLASIIVTLMMRMTIDLINARQRANKQKEIIQHMRYLGERINNEIKMSEDILEIGDDYILLSSTDPDVGVVRVEYSDREVKIGRGNEGDCNATQPCSVIGQDIDVSEFHFTDSTKQGQTNHTISYAFSIKIKDIYNAKKLDFTAEYSTSISNEVTKVL